MQDYDRGSCFDVLPVVWSGRERRKWLHAQNITLHCLSTLQQRPFGVRCNNSWGCILVPSNVNKMPAHRPLQFFYYATDNGPEITRSGPEYDLPETQWCHTCQSCQLDAWLGVIPDK